MIEDSQLDFVLNGHPWWVCVPLAVLLAIAIVKLYQREIEPLQRGGNLIRTIRAAVIILLVALLAQPVLYESHASYQPPVVIVLRDVSLSMKVKDGHEPIERRIRTAVKLGLLDEKLRDVRAEQAARAATEARRAAETALASGRQSLQLLQEGGANQVGANYRLRDARQALALAYERTEDAVDLVKEVPSPPASLMESALSGISRAEQQKRDLDEIDLNAPKGPDHLSKTLQGLKRFVKNLEDLAKGSRRFQDRLDRSLGRRNDPAVREGLERLAGMDRTDRVATMLDNRLATVLGERVRIQSYPFDTRLREDGGPSAGEGDASKARTGETRRERQDTDLATPLLRVAEIHAQDSIAAVVVCSDGRHTSGPVPEEAARSLAARGIPLHTLGVGSVDPPADLCVARLEGTSSVFRDESIRLTAHIKAVGYAGHRARLLLLREGEVLENREITFETDGWRREQFELMADRSGPNIYVATIEPLEGPPPKDPKAKKQPKPKPLPKEALDSNNRAEALVDVANDRMRVLLVDWLPRWETRFVASLLRRERKMILDERWLSSGERLGPRPNALPDVTQSLDEYDIVILGDIPPSRLEQEDQLRISRYVSDRGGFLVLIAGAESMPRAYLTGPLAELLPITRHVVEGTSAPLGLTDAPSRVRLKLNPAASRHEIIRVLRDPTLNEQLWPALPELQWIARPAFAKPGATALLHADDARKDAVVAVHHYGSGRVLYVGTDNTWRWRYKIADRVHAFFWSQAVRWGTSNRLAGGPRLKVGLVRQQIRPGEDVEVLARPRDHAGRPVRGAVVIAELGDKDNRRRVQLQPVPDSGGLYRGLLSSIGAGMHAIRVTVETAGFEGVERTLQAIAREVAGQEGVELARDTARLKNLAQVGEGRHLDILNADKLFEDLAGQGKEQKVESSYELWSSYPALLLVVLLLVIEWMVRKKVGLA